MNRYRKFFSVNVRTLVLGMFSSILIPISSIATETDVNTGEIGTWITGTLKFYDADGFYIENFNIRVWGIDGVEKRQTCTLNSGINYPCGEDVTKKLKELFDGQTANCFIRDKNHYQLKVRYVAQCSLGRLEDYGHFALQSGYARAYVRFLRGTEYQKTYLEAETLARKSKRGLWSGDWDAPWLWRSRVQNHFQRKPSKHSFVTTN
ncbi:MAG: hypothetical protein COA43_00440 [Robiginitomaculum sp.]|nr:MAG: hypothetical protein COA43_00440 [Robiginitomaculum sp.]